MEVNFRKYFYKNNIAHYMLAIVFVILFAVCNIAVAFVLQELMDVAYIGKMSGLNNAIRNTVVVLALLIITDLLKVLFTNIYIRKALKQYKNYIFTNIMSKNISSFNKESSSTYISAFSNDLATIEQKYLVGNLEIILNISLFVGTIIAMAYMNFVMFVITIATSLIPIIASVLVGDKIEQAEKNVSSSNSQFVALVKDLLTGFTVIKSFKAVVNIEAVFKEKNADLENIKKKKKDTEGLIEIINVVSGTIVEITVISVGVYFAVKGTITAGAVLAYIQLLNYLLGPISSLGVKFANRNAAIALIKKLEGIVKESNYNDGCKSLEGFHKSIRYEGVSFAYDPNKKILNHITLTFEKNKSYAIVGGSGSGKSTLLNLLLGYYDNYEGNIWIDSGEIREISTNSLYDILSIIQQNVFVFDNSIEENITLFKEFDKHKINHVIKCSGLSKLIHEKGETYKCGENGVNLSGGEKQRISIARSLLRGTPILLMDEATAALDNETSHMIEEEVLSIKELTKIIVTHRLDENILRKYDQIIVMNQGSVIEIGKFDELMDRKAGFYSLYTASNISSNKKDLEMVLA